MKNRFQKLVPAFVTRFLQTHPEIDKLVKFSMVGLFCATMDMLLFFFLVFVAFRGMKAEPYDLFGIFHYDGIGYFLAFLISTGSNYTLAFILNRKHTFRADSNPALSAVLYFVMIAITVFSGAWIGVALMDWFQAKDMVRLGEFIVKPLASLIPSIWVYPMNRFVIHRHKKP